MDRIENAATGPSSLRIYCPSRSSGGGQNRLFQSHGSWMESMHYRTGAKALLSYNVSKGPELSNPMDLNSAPTGNMCFILTEIYESKAGVVDHLEQTGSWGDSPAMGKWMEKCKVTFVPAAFISNSLW